MKIQTMESFRRTIPGDHTAKPATKSRLKRLFERQFPGAGKVAAVEMEKKDNGSDGGCGETEPSSICLDKMVRNFIEESNDKPARCGRRRCNCFNGTCSDSSDDELDFPLADDAAELLKGFVLCVSVVERNLLADSSRIVERNRACRGKDDCRRIVAEELRSLGYDAAICTSRWEKTPTMPAGNYEYIDVLVEGDRRRLLVDIDFRSEFEIARSTKAYRAALQSLPSIFVGNDVRLRQIITVVSEAARVSLVKKGLHVPPWRTLEYMTSKWLASSLRSGTDIADPDDKMEKPSVATAHEREAIPLVDRAATCTVEEAEKSPWMPPAVRPKTAPPAKGSKIIAGLASVLREGE